MRKGREEWEQDLIARQRNIGFPDTVQNEGRFWRNLTNGKQKLTFLQGIGIALFFLVGASIIWSDAASTLRYESSGPTFERLEPVLIKWAVVLALFVVFFLLFRWRVRR